ncbi:MAG: S9 family peptidase [Pseudomonadales bacterium]|nr:S9 family peptidase [Pseudomonadales bacterium]MBO6597261.1 S9 family peptidase [Pseudomonadales bacterium]MBO6823553.1 S9 family peptidase [Pseudomonadales bacterium]
MIRLSIIFLGVSLMAGCSETPETAEPQKLEIQTVAYPETHKNHIVDTYFETDVADPYRWLEDDRSDETAAWVSAQNEVTFDYLKEISYRESLQDRLESMWNYEKETAPFREGDYLYFYRNNGLQNQYVVYRQSDDGTEEVFLDPNGFSEDGTTSLADLSFSKDGSLAAFAISEGGSDWRKIVVIDVESGEVLEPELVDVKFSGISWYGNEGFYYSRYEKPEGSELSAKVDQHLLYYHRVGTPQADDQLVFGGAEEEKRRYVFGGVTEDDRYLIVVGAQSTSGNDLFIRDLSLADGELVQVVSGFESDVNVIDSEGSTLYAITNKNAPNQRLVKFDARSPTDWEEVIPERPEVLSVTTGGGYFFAHYMVDAISKVIQFERSGKEVRRLALPDVGTADLMNTKSNEATLYYTFTNYRLPSTIYAVDMVTGVSKVHRTSQANFASDQYESKQVFYTSKDGTQVPMIISYKKGLELNGKNPTILYGYGGFNISLTPQFSIVNAVWMQAGGVYAVPNLRGGGEYGKQWHLAGTLMNKQNVFDDFIAAGEYLIREGYTSSDYLAVRGGSNGGLLVGAVMTQRPDLMKVALPAVGVLDMLRYHTFTAGAGWAYDYGTAEQSEEMFEYLFGYSPVHNVKDGVSYPATLITTADHDDRVVPAHSFKFAAELQAKTAGPAPTLIRIDTKAGHGAGTPVSMLIEQYSDVLSFTLHNMGIEQLPQVLPVES